MDAFDQATYYGCMVGQLLTWLWLGTATSALALLLWLAWLTYRYERQRRRERGPDDRLVHK